MEIVDPSGWRSTAWGNAQGTSHEIWRMPEGDGPYAARVSIADITASGPFTALPGYRRWLAVLDDGGGLSLAIGTRFWTGVRGASVAFGGGEPVHASITRPARVWNLITRDDLAWTAAWHELAESAVVPAGVAIVHAATSGVTQVIASDRVREVELPAGGAILVHLDGGR
jgi:environmental stress-induced protein Ves